MNRAFRVPNGTKYMVILVQDGEGCDYTIGCGVKVEPLKARTVEDARAEAQRTIMSDGYLEREDAVYKAVLVTDHEDLPVESWKAGMKAIREAEEAEEQRAKELSELERLKRKYGG